LYPNSEAFNILWDLPALGVFRLVRLRVTACLGAWLALLGLRSDLGGFARELVGFNCPIFSKNSLTLKLHRLYRVAKITKKMSILSILAISPNLKK
jgi:hypothetical protein